MESKYIVKQGNRRGGEIGTRLDVVNTSYIYLQFDDGTKYCYPPSYVEEVKDMKTTEDDPSIGKYFEVINSKATEYGRKGKCVERPIFGITLDFGTHRQKYSIYDVKPTKEEKPMKTTNDSFYLVWSQTGRTPPSFRHDTQSSAETEAKRLARENPGTEFFVLETKYSVVSGEAKEKKFTTPDQQPPF